MKMSRLQQRPHRRRLTKTRRTYREPDSDTDTYLASPIISSRPTRSSRRIQTYAEPNTTEDEILVSSESGSDCEPKALSQKVAKPVIRSTLNSRNTHRSRNARECRTHKRQPSNSSPLSSLKRKKRSCSGRIQGADGKVKMNNVTTTLVNVHAPPWQTLEYRTLVKIMQYSAYPLFTSTFRSSSSIEWLVNMSLLSKSFHEAAMAALLWEPPLLPAPRAHGLITLLEQDHEFTTLNFQTKIRSLDIEVKHLLVKKAGIDLEKLLSHTPQLSHLRIFHAHDEMVGKAVWAEPKISHFKWNYGNLFRILDNNGIRLRSFEWNGRFQDTLDAMQSAHLMPCMQNLQALSIVNFNFMDKVENERLRTRDCVALSLSHLSNLQKLEFRNCTILDTVFMARFPLSLNSLKIVNCLSMTSEAVESYLSLGGNGLRTLHLEGNQVMDLAFMPRLADLCPHLEHLFIDLSYEDSSSYRDRNPLYDDLLPNGSPTWPTSLISIFIGPLRALELADAEDFYSSLVNAAGNLPYLRALSIKTILNEASWRDRASLRAKWRPVFEKVFAADKTYQPGAAKLQIEDLRTRSTKRKSARLQEIEELGASSEGGDGEDLAPEWSSATRQNRCELVEFELSDQRPAQEQFREVDFLDSEPSGDDEWNGSDQVTGRSSAW